jgi:general secretion pathway protein B
VASTQPASTPSAVTAAAATAPLLSELPIDIRGQIPALAISGSVYSDNPSQRLLLINGQVLPQGSQVAPDVTLVEIQRGSSEFSFRGTRFRLAH